MDLLHIYQNFVEVEEIVRLRKGTYTELTHLADSRSVLFRFEKRDEWDSIPLESLHTTVDGFRQCFSRIYDVQDDAFVFTMLEGIKTLDVKKVLSRKSKLWDGKPKLSVSEVLTICDKLIEKVIWK